MYDLIYNVLTYDRVELALATVAQLLQHQEENTFLDIIDDHSTEDISKLHELIGSVSPETNVRFTVNQRNLGRPFNQVTRLNDEIYDKHEFVYLSDNDVRLSSRFAAELSDLADLMRDETAIIASTLFNTHNGLHRETGTLRGGYVYKTSLGGVSMLIRAKDFHAAMDHYLTPQYAGIQGWDWAVCHFAEKTNRTLVSTKSSFVEHVGATGLNSRPSLYDQASDFIE